MTAQFINLHIRIYVLQEVEASVPEAERQQEARRSTRVASSSSTSSWGTRVACIGKVCDPMD